MIQEEKGVEEEEYIITAVREDCPELIILRKDAGLGGRRSRNRMMEGSF